MTLDVTDETLTAYLDGELSEPERAEVEEALATDPTLSERLHDLEIPLQEMRGAFDQLLSNAPELPEVAPPARRGFSAVALIAAVFVGAAVSGVFGVMQQSDPLSDWKMAVANYQVLYVPETIAVSAPSAEATVERLEQLSEVLGRDLTAAQSAEGLEFRRGQILGLDNTPLIQLAYAGDNDRPFALCITRVDEGAYAPTSEKLAGLAAAHWVEDGYGYLIIGGDDLGFVQGIAQSLHGQI